MKTFPRTLDDTEITDLLRKYKILVFLQFSTMVNVTSVFKEYRDSDHYRRRTS